MCLSSSRSRKERFFLGFLLMKSIPQKKKREEKGDRGVFVMLDEIMLFVCYTSS